MLKSNTVTEYIYRIKTHQLPQNLYNKDEDLILLMCGKSIHY